MHLLERTATVTVTPNFEEVKEGLSKFHWKMHLSLPYPFPSKDCVHQSLTILGKPFAFSIHNHFRRVIQAIGSGEAGPVYFRVFLEDKRVPPVEYTDCISTSREELQSVVFFEDQTDYASPNEAFAGADAKIKACFDWLSSFLTACQRAAPYLTSWLVHPISMFDVGTVYHDVDAFCENHQQRHLFASAVAVSVGRHLQHPTFVMEVPDSIDDESPMDAANELLAEALMSLYRGMPRLTVLNSYTAVESLANVVFSTTKIAKLVSNNMPKDMAEETVEDERKRHRTEGQFLYHKGIKAASGRSLLEENKQQYDALLKLQELRHKVAHTGYKPTHEEAQTAHKVCCETAQWLAGVAGFPVKLLVPDAASSAPGFSTAFKDAQARSAGEFELIRHLLGAVPSQGPAGSVAEND